ncbi:hypothetical protein [Niameybacter massiliensis]|uniref:hypothetical protein n=1 Tax=Niameybacter massiliensis TaxID=1658108 RepID=UPI0006B68FE3|nr:hypothetical protein [Niameybacter massiliensis]
MNEIQRIEELNDKFRDALITERELYHSRTMANPAEEKEMQILMKQYINEAKEILTQQGIKTREELKAISKKYFMVEFLNELFKDQTYNSEAYNVEIDIDCGL